MSSLRDAAKGWVRRVSDPGPIQFFSASNLQEFTQLLAEGPRLPGPLQLVLSTVVQGTKKVVTDYAAGWPTHTRYHLPLGAWCYR